MKRLMRRFFLVILCLVLFTSAFGCKKADDTPQDDNTPTIYKIVTPKPQVTDDDIKESTTKALEPTPTMAGTRYTVTLDPGEGTLEQTVYTYAIGETINLPTPENKFGTFAGWVSADTKNEIENGSKWMYNFDVTLTATWTRDVVIEFGSYPQSKVEDENTQLTLLALSGDLSTWNSGFGENTKIVEYNGEKYLGCYRTALYDFYYEYRSSYYDWFKFEPIEWVVLEVSGNKAFLLANCILDYHEFGDANDNKYDNSEMRYWLNEEFYENAFSLEEQSLIKTTYVDNSKESANNEPGKTYVCENTYDKIFLLSTKEAIALEPSFLERNFTDFAEMRGLTDNRWYLRSIIYDGWYGNSYWRFIEENGYLDYSNHKPAGVVPALHLILE